MQTALLDVPLNDVRARPELYKEKTLVMGGLIVSTSITEKGSQIEAVHVRTDSRGNLKNVGLINGRYLALFPKEKGLLDPLIYGQGREVTIAGRLIEISTGKIGEMEYTFPVFEIIEIYLWEEKKYTHPEPYYYPYPYPYWHDRWGRPYPPWW